VSNARTSDRTSIGLATAPRPSTVWPLRNGSKFIPIVVIALLLIPHVVWIFKAQWVWPWDAAYYAEETLRIYHQAADGPLSWLRALILIPDSRAPLLPWMAQATTPFINVVESPERALLLTNIAASSVTLWLIYSQVRRLGGNGPAVLIGMLACGGAPPFVAFNHHFLVEVSQMLAIAGMAWIASRADDLSMLRLLSGTAIWASLAMLAKTTSVAFVLPLLGYIVIARIATQGSVRAPTRVRDSGLVLGAVLISGATIMWYSMHWSGIVAHVAEATVGDTALLYGSNRPFLAKFAYWSWELLLAVSPSTLFSASMLAVGAIGLGLAVVRQLFGLVENRLRVAVQSGLLFLLWVAATVVFALVAYSTTVEEEPRFVSPMVPLVAIWLGGTFATWNRRWLVGFAAAGLAVNWAIVQLTAAGIISVPGAFGWWLQPPPADVQSMDLLTRAVHVTCEKGRAGHLSVIGADLLNFSASSASFYAEKMRGELGYRCSYDSLGYAEKDSDRAIRSLYESNADWFVTLPSERLPTSEADPFNRVSRAVATWVASSPDFERVTSDGDELIVYRRRR
jgi:Dolichyl-phosphate-mannose-protein mannosyltransferase